MKNWAIKGVPIWPLGPVNGVLKETKAEAVILMAFGKKREWNSKLLTIQ
jgi:hypothetical protein